MAAPWMALGFSKPLFAVVFAIAFTNELSTVSGWIAAGGVCVADDFSGGMLGWKRGYQELTLGAKITSVAIGAIATLSELPLNRLRPPRLGV